MDNMKIGFYEVMDDIIKRLKGAGCKVVTFGDEPDYARDKNVVTPAAHISPTSFSVTNSRVSVLGFEIFIYGQIAFHNVKPNNEPKFGEKNTVDILDESMAIGSRFVSPILERTLQVDGTNNGWIKLQGSIPFTPVYQDGNDSIAGVIGTALFTFTAFNSSCG